MSLKQIFVCLIVLFTLTPVYSQIPSEDDARKELERRGIDEQELRERLLNRGVDIDNIDANNPSELLRTQKIVDEVIAEIESEKQAELSRTTDTLIVENEQKDELKESNTEKPEIKEDNNTEVKEPLPEAQNYGQHLFRNNSVKYYEQAEYAKPPSNYILGPGDQVSIAIWGGSELNFSQTISSDGFIKLDKIPRIYISGLSIKEARAAIKRKLSRNYVFTDNTFEVTVSTSRTINVNITGEVFNVGTYSISALNNTFNALVAAGGPSDIGSVRNIHIARAGEPTRTLDIYKFLQDPLKGDNLYLNENDFIIVPVAEKVVEIKGAVNRPYKYELLKNENLDELINYAGGLKATALKRNIKITRIENDELVILNVNFQELERNREKFSLSNGDIVEVQNIIDEYNNTVSIDGAVELPGEYAFKKNQKISDLLYLSKPDESAILNNAYLIRLNDDQKTVRYHIIDISDVLSNPRSEENIELKRGDKLLIRSKKMFSDTKEIEVSGAVRMPGKYSYNNDELKVSDAIFLSGGLTNMATDFAFIYREKEGESGSEYININLDKVAKSDEKHDIVLKPGDKVIVYDRTTFEDNSFISVSGSVKEPKEIPYDSSLTVRKALLLAGGLTFDASYEQIDVFRLDFSDNKKTKTYVANLKVDKDYNVLGGYGDFKLSAFDQIYVRTAPEFELQRTVKLKGEIKYPGTYALVSDNTKLSEIIILAGGLSNEAFLGGTTLFRNLDSIGYVIVDVEKALKNPNSAFNAILQEGDEIFIPKKNELVTVTGAVLAKEMFTEKVASTGKYSFVFEKGKNAKYYVDKYAGGVAKNGSSAKISVTYPNGEVKRTTKFLFFNNYPKVEPGSIINVGLKEKKNKENGQEKEDIDWGKVLSDSVAQATTILTLVILINNLD